MRNINVLLRFAAAVGPLLAVSVSVSAEEDLQQTVNELRSQIEFLNARLMKLEQKLTEKEAAAENEKSGGNQKKESKKVEVGDIKGSIKIPGTETSLALGGYVKLDAIYNSQSVGGSGGGNLGDQMLQPGSIPVGSDEGEDSQFTFHARQSRIWLTSKTPTEWGGLDTYLEMDFFAFQSPGDERVSNSYAPRMRHAYGSLGGFLAGQTWTAFMNSQALPELNDFGGPVGRIFVRQAQIRWTQPFTVSDVRAEWLAAVENPESTLTDIEGKRETPDDDRFPDLITRFSLYPSWGVVSLAAMLRNIRSEGQYESDAYGGAVSLAGRIKTIGRDDLRFMLNYGNALGRYASSNLFNDAAVGARGKIELFDQYGGFIAYRHWWNPTWRSTLAYGFNAADNPNFVPGTVSRWAQSAQLNLLWSPVLQTTFGVEYTYASRSLENGDSGDLHRIQFSSVFNF
ncbi:MAG: DcaP family trimeric outer membrane transporter [Gammaproteobacteria bacterium]